MLKMSTKPRGIVSQGYTIQYLCKKGGDFLVVNNHCNLCSKAGDFSGSGQLFCQKEVKAENLV